MFTRSELEIKTIPELRDWCRRYGIKPTGNPGYKTSHILSLMAFPPLALQQSRVGCVRLDNSVTINRFSASDAPDNRH
ncbi:hypothetical protein NIES4074_16730 [Cylindrospermum sp. NIES-4074]|nr:hypothetical protein NIES4074_16730 [Cylindrospermum sp. NIES-4074]